LEDPKPAGKTYGDFLFNNETFDGWKTDLATNTIAPFFLTMAFLGLLEAGAKRRPGGTSSVINISSAASQSKVSLTSVCRILEGKPLLTIILQYAYGTTKAGLEYLTRLMATEFALRGIPVRVNSLVPGIFPSEMSAAAGNEGDDIAQVPLPGALAAPPLKRMGRSVYLSWILDKADV
jgi:NAD(P)-dependent dehydrogenase (short-subunit alcohol dehydrogenase family)